MKGNTKVKITFPTTVIIGMQNSLSRKVPKDQCNGIEFQFRVLDKNSLVKVPNGSLCHRFLIYVNSGRSNPNLAVHGCLLAGDKSHYL